MSDAPILEAVLNARARQLMLLGREAQDRELVAHEARDPGGAAKLREWLSHVTQYTTFLTSRKITRVGLWHRHWRDIKLQAFSHRFHEGQEWDVREGDLFCVTKYGQALYQVVGFSELSIRMRTLCQDDGDLGTTENPLPPDHDWTASEFQYGGFAEDRVHIPEWLWPNLASANNFELIDSQ